MQIINQSYKIETKELDIFYMPMLIEGIGRTCYKSEDKISEGTADEFCRKLIKNGHEAMLEHAVITVRFITDRGVTHELVRHRIGTAFAQESTRYVRYGGNMEFIRPVFSWAQIGYIFDHEKKFNDTVTKWQVWLQAMKEAEENYAVMLELGCAPQEARSVLPNSLKTEIVVSANIREWRHIFKLRTAKSAHPQIVALMKPLLEELKSMIPVLFGDIG